MRMSGKEEELSRMETMLKDHERRIKLLEQQLAGREEVQGKAVALSPVGVLAAAAPPSAPTREKSTVRQLVAGCGVSGREVSEVLECAIAHGLMCWDPETGLYQATQLGKERADAEVASNPGAHSLV